jgi:hypothetical protein
MTPQDARMVLDTIRQVKASGILSRGFVDQIIKRWPRTIGGGSGKLEFFKFVEDYRPAGTLARRCDRSGTIYEPTSAAIRINHQWNKPAGANADYYGLCYNTGSRWEFLQGPCPDLSCDEAASAIDLGTPPEATVNEVYEHEIIVTDFAGEPTITGLPDGLTADITSTGDDEWTITITGTPTTEGEFTIIVSGTTLENDCPIAAGFNLLVNPCDVGTSEIVIGELPEATEFEEYDHEITFTDVDDIEILGLPPEIGATIGSGTITLHSDELPAESVWQVTIRGTTPENGCPIEVQFTINIGPCDASGSYYSTPSQSQLTWYIRANAVDCCLGQFNLVTIFASQIENVTASGLPAWLELTTASETESGALVQIQGTPLTDECAVDEDVYDGGTQLGTTNLWYWDVELTGDSMPNGCTVKTTVRVWLNVSCDTCPDPTDYEALGASFDWNPVLQPGQPHNWTTGGGLSHIVDWDNVTDISVSGEPAGAIVSIGPGGYPSSVVIEAGTQAAGTYVVTITGTVESGEHEGCEITFTYTFQVEED